MRSTFTGAAGAYRFTLLAGAACLAMPGAALAQDAEPEVDSPESSNVIIVTATKREQTLQETPIAVSVTSGEVIERAQIRDVLDLQSVVPSLRVSQLQTSSATTFIIRGFGNGDNNFGVEPSVGVFIDGVFRSRSAAALSDLNMISRVEVLSGPQSTLFGKNASAGVISIVTKEPQYEFGGQIEASYGNFDSINLRGEVTGPIAENIAFSLDGTYQQRDGIGRIVNLNNAEINDRNRWSVRGNLLIEPTADVKIRLIADYTDIDEICCQTANLVIGPVTREAITAVGGQFTTDFFADDNFLNVIPRNLNENYGFSGQVDWQVGNFTLTSITSYRELRNSFSQDVDFTSADLTAETRDQRVDTFTQEFRIASDFDGPLNFLLGGFYFDETIKQDSSLSINGDFREFAAFNAISGGFYNDRVNPNGPRGRFRAGSLVPGLTPAAQIALGQGLLAQVDQQLGLPIGSALGGGFLSTERFTLDNESWSIFGTVDFEPVDGLVFTAGFNYTDDRKQFTNTTVPGDPLATFNVIDAFITQATLLNPNLPDVRTRDQFLALPAPVRQQLQAVALTSCPPGSQTNCNPLLPLADLQFQTGFLDVPNALEPGRTKDDEFTYLFRVSYEVMPELNIYASYATGFKASSVNLSRDSRPPANLFTPGVGPRPAPDGSNNFRGSTFLAPSSPIVDAGLATPNLSNGTRIAGPEEAEVYEIGMKGQWDGFGFNLALFDQTIENFQSFIFTGLGFTLLNAGQQSVRGFEFDATVQPTDGLVFTFAATHLDPVFDSFPNPVLGDLTGERPGGIPAWSLRTSATHTLELGSNGTTLVTRVDYSHESNVDINNGLPTFNFDRGETRIFQREVNLVNASMMLGLSSGLEVGAFARNLLNERWILTVADGVAQGGTVFGYPSLPRTYGGVVRYRF